MTGDVVNLRRFKKTKAREAAEAQAAANRQKFGRSREERDAARLEENRAARLLDGHRLGDGEA